jgi:hypothetical protein
MDHEVKEAFDTLLNPDISQCSGFAPTYSTVVGPSENKVCWMIQAKQHV